MTGVLTGFAVVAVVIAVGYLVARVGVLGAEGQQALSRFAFFVATPPLLFSTVSRADVGTALSGALAVTAVSSTAAALGYVAASRLVARADAAETTVGALSASYVNAANLGLPVAVYVLGDGSFVAPVLLFQLLVMAPVAFLVLDTAGASGRAATGRRSLARRLVTPVRNPVTVATLLGFAVSLSGVTLPAIVAQPAALLGGAAVPVVLVAFGMSLRGSPRPGTGEGSSGVWLAVAIKNVGQPAVAAAVGSALGMHGHALFAVVVVAALPTAQNVFVYATRYGRGQALARQCVLLSTVLSVPVLLAVSAVFTRAGAGAAVR